MGRSSDIVFQIQHRRAERKKPKINAKLKKVSIENNQMEGIAAAQENKPPPITVQKTGGRNSVALTFSVILHVTIALLLGFLYIKDQILTTTDDLAVALVPQEPPLTKRSIIKPPDRRNFKVEQQEIQAPIQRTIVTNANIPRTGGDMALPSPLDTDLAPVGPSPNDGPKIRGIGKSLKAPIQTPSTSITPKLERPSQNPPPTPDLEFAPAIDSPGLKEIEIETTEKGVTPPKTIKKVEPTYPKNAKQAEKEGTVILLATIGTDGIAKDIKAETSLGFGLEDAAIAALKKFKFVPAKKNGADVALAVRIPFEFTLKDK